VNIYVALSSKGKKRGKSSETDESKTIAANGQLYAYLYNQPLVFTDPSGQNGGPIMTGGGTTCLTRNEVEVPFGTGCTPWAIGVDRIS